MNFILDFFYEFNSVLPIVDDLVVYYKDSLTLLTLGAFINPFYSNILCCFYFYWLVYYNAIFYIFLCFYWLQLLIYDNYMHSDG